MRSHRGFSPPSTLHASTPAGAVWRAARLGQLVVALAVAAGALAIGAAASPQSVPDFGPNVKIFDPSMSTTDIKATVDAIAGQQISNEFGTQRYALLFMPGTYGSTADPLNVQVGYYTEVSGLGSSPGDVSVNGTIDSYNRCYLLGCNALVNFWRSLSNLTINVAGKTDCRSGEFWATSQASPLRRVDVNGYVTLQDYCSGLWSNASGGFIADSRFSNSTVFNGLQQQYLVRNSSLGGWTNAAWNQVFAGVKNAPPQAFPSPPYTTLDTNPAAREKPFLYVDSTGHFNVYVPTAQFNSSGTSWQNGQTPGRSIPIENFFIARPTDTVQTINDALAQGKNLIFTPGIYNIDKTITITRADTVVLGLGMATLDVQNGVAAMTVADVPGVEISGLIVDAGPVNSAALLRVGTALNPTGSSDPTDPTALHDVFFRVGGAHVGKASASLVVNSDDVTATGLFVEHYQRYNVRWNGNNGKTIMFQNELPYDPPSQTAWQHNGVLGYADYKVD